jgi:hypothetical protein
MAHLPYHTEGEGAQVAYHVIPDNIKGGWNVYDTHQPDKPQQHFETKQQAVEYAEQMSMQDGVGFAVEEYEAPEIGR